MSQEAGKGDKGKQETRYKRDNKDKRKIKTRQKIPQESGS